VLLDPVDIGSAQILVVVLKLETDIFAIGRWKDGDSQRVIQFQQMAPDIVPKELILGLM
jgi:hypothetical protein